MSCRACEETQELSDVGSEHWISYVRVGNGNVRLTGCRRHLAELIDIYRRGLDRSDDD